MRKNINEQKELQFVSENQLERFWLYDFDKFVSKRNIETTISFEEKLTCSSKKISQR